MPKGTDKETARNSDSVLLHLWLDDALLSR